MRSGKKLRVGVVFGGRSVEHEVSLVSAQSVLEALDRKKFTVIPIGITPAGKWTCGPDTLHRLRRGRGPGAGAGRIIVPDPSVRGLAGIGGKFLRSLPVDVLFPVLHGSYGEDGTIQGLFELAGIPYVGAGVLASALAMDKAMTKLLWQEADLPVLPFLHFGRREYRTGAARILRSAERSLGYPCFVKPSNSGSSIGISKARNRRELRKAIAVAFRYDTRVLVEKGIDRAREIEVAVLGNDRPRASVPGEILPSAEFYDYDAKYIDGASTPVIPARLPAALTREIRRTAVRAYRSVGCEGMARVDFLIHPKTKKFYLSEINTIPGFTSISMFPRLWEATGVPYRTLLTTLIRLAVSRHRERSALRTAYRPGKMWYR